MRFTLVDPRRWSWENTATYRVDIRRQTGAAIRTEEYVVSDAADDVRDIISNIESMLRPGDTFQLYVIVHDPERGEGLLQLI